MAPAHQSEIALTAGEIVEIDDVASTINDGPRQERFRRPQQKESSLRWMPEVLA
jgi:hypothetical protein